MLVDSCGDLFGHNMAEGKQAWRDCSTVASSISILMSGKLGDVTPMIIEGITLASMTMSRRITGHLGCSAREPGKRNDLDALED